MRELGGLRERRNLGGNRQHAKSARLNHVVQELREFGARVEAALGDQYRDLPLSWLYPGPPRGKSRNSRKAS